MQERLAECSTYSDAETKSLEQDREGVGPAEISMAVTLGMSSKEHDVAEALTTWLLEKGLDNRPVWFKSSEDHRIHLQIKGFSNGNTLADFDPAAFVGAELDDLKRVLAERVFGSAT